MSRAFAALAAALSLMSSCTHHEAESGAAGLLYGCADGRSARIFYEGGGDPARGRARLEFDGRTTELIAAPAASGLRYAGETLVWSAEGDEAVIGEAGEAGEREIVRCTRVREGETAPAPHAPDSH